MFTFKDLGKIKNKDNKTIKPNMIIKSGYLYKLKKSKVKQLQEHHLAKVIDLRTEAERAQKPDRQIEGVKYVNIPLFNEKIATVTHEEENSLKDLIELLKNAPYMVELYSKMVTDEYAVLQLKKIINEIVNSADEDYAVLYHCSIGKDRTGIVTLILLSILDVDIKEITKDYMFLKKKFRYRTIFLYCLVIIALRSKSLAKKMKNVYYTDEKNIEIAIESINNSYGSMDIFIRDYLGITDEAKERFKAKVLE